MRAADYRGTTGTTGTGTGTAMALAMRDGLR